MTVVGFAIWPAFVVLVALGAWLRRAANSAAACLARRGRSLLPAQSYAAGAEVDLLLGTTRPWIVAVGQAVPVAVAAWVVPNAFACSS